MTKASIRRQLKGLRERLSPPGSRAFGVTIDTRSNQIRSVLTADAGNRPAPDGLRIEDLPAGCFIHRYDPSQECATLYRSTADGQAHVQRVLGVDEDIILGRKPCWNAPMSEWPAIFERQCKRGEDCESK
jgi:hypothetical protein